jgi:hypothetical protein
MSAHHVATPHFVTDHEREHDFHIAKMLARFIDEAKAAGHKVTHAQFHGPDGKGIEDLLDEHSPTRAGAFEALALATTSALAIFAAALMPFSPARAADLNPPVKKAAAPVNPFQYPTGTGWFVGIGTEGGAGSATVPMATSAGSNPNSVTTRLFIYYNERVIEGTVNEDAGAEIRDGIKSVVNLGACRRLAISGQQLRSKAVARLLHGCEDRSGDAVRPRRPDPRRPA